MRKMFLVLFVVLVLASCDISNFLPPGIWEEEREESVVYTLESGDSVYYFGFVADTVIRTGKSVQVGPLNLTVNDDGMAVLPFGEAVVILGDTCITITYPGEESLVYSSL